MMPRTRSGGPVNPMKTTTRLLIGLLAAGAILALAPGAAADDRYEACYGDASAAEVCHTKDIVFPDYAVGVHTALFSHDVYWA